MTRPRSAAGWVTRQTRRLMARGVPLPWRALLAAHWRTADHTSAWALVQLHHGAVAIVSVRQTGARVRITVVDGPALAWTGTAWQPQPVPSDTP
jgi:hypothetical protein